MCVCVCVWVCGCVGVRACVRACTNRPIRAECAGGLSNEDALVCPAGVDKSKQPVVIFSK